MTGAETKLLAALDAMPRGLAAHVLRVAEEAQRLARMHGIDEGRVRIAALSHDLLRAHTSAELLTIADAQGYAMDASERIEPVLMHGPLAVPLLRQEYGISDEDVLAAAARHTTAGPGMSPLQVLIFIADKIEPQKLARGAAVLRARELAETSLDAAMLVYLDFHIEYALAHRWPLHPATIAARNELLASDKD